MFNFEKLDAWQLAVKYAARIYKATIAIPTDERFGLTSQLRRAAVSISANLAEGSGRGTQKDFIRFIEIAFGSLMETVSHIAIARQEHYVTAEVHKELYSQAERLGKVLSGLRRSLE
ncbi:MAG: four helix bundle protein [Planctomycetaceae bacterium]|nr:four helix bundle protein [Planctomycetaceae bacterium]